MRMPLRLWARIGCREPLRELARHKLRSGLAALGIMIGVAAFILVVAIGRAGTERAEAQLQNLGDSLVWVEAGSRNVNGVRTGTRGMNTLTPEDADAIRRELPLIKSVSENVDGRLQVIYGNRNWQTLYRGVSPEYLDIKRWRMSEGEFFTTYHVEHVENVVVIGQTVREQLFGPSDAVGRIVRIQGSPFVILGVLDRKGQSAFGWDQDDTILMPWTTVQRKIRGKGATWVDDILCSAQSMQDVGPAADAISSLLRQRHRIPAGTEDDFNIRRPDELIKAEIKSSQTLEYLLMTLALISLLVGGVGIMNVMLASVAQRTGEIGIRVAVGAPAWAIQLQFLGEAVILSVVGGALGVLLSFLGASLAQQALGWSVPPSLQATILALGSASAVGISFGFFPAWKAAQLDPIAAIHHE